MTLSGYDYIRILFFLQYISRYCYLTVLLHKLFVTYHYIYIYRYISIYQQMLLDITMSCVYNYIFLYIARYSYISLDIAKYFCILSYITL